MSTAATQFQKLNGAFEYSLGIVSLGAAGTLGLIVPHIIQTGGRYAIGIVSTGTGSNVPAVIDSS